MLRFTGPAIDRVFARLKYDHGCWTWTGSVMGTGYGNINRSDLGSTLVHRIVFEHFNGSIGDGLEIDHLCRNKLCCNPIHLEAVTMDENSARGVSRAGFKQGRTISVCKYGHAIEGGNARTIQTKRDGLIRMCKRCHDDRMRRFKNRKQA